MTKKLRQATRHSFAGRAWVSGHKTRSINRESKLVLRSVYNDIKRCFNIPYFVFALGEWELQVT